MNTDKIDLHYQQQLSAWMDGDLPSDEARFLLRRLQHDAELTGRLERWQLCGDALRGNAQAPAPAGFAERVAAAVEVEPSTAVATPRHADRPRRSLRVWGGGALAASVAAIALFMVRQQVPEETPVPAVASQSPALAGNAEPALPAAPAAALTAASVAVAAAPRRQAASPQRRSATRAQQAASRSVASARLPERAVATAAVAVPVVHALAGASSVATSQRDPFSSVQINSPAARPWPRAVLPQYPSSSGGFNAGFSSDRAVQSFYPFEPRVTERLPVPRTGPAPQE